MPCAASCSAGARPAVLRLYDPTEADRTYHTGDQALLLVLDEGDGGAGRHHDGARGRGVPRRAHRADVAHVDHWLERRNDVAALEALITRGYVVDTMEVAGRWRDLAGDLPARRSTRSTASPGTMAASAHQSHSYPDGRLPVLHVRRARCEPDERDRYYRAVWDAGSRAVLAAGGALSHHHGVGLNRSRFVAEALGTGVRCARRHEAGPRPERHPEPGQARAALAVRPHGLLTCDRR